MRFLLPVPVSKPWYPHLTHLIETYSTVDVDVFLMGAVEETIVGLSEDHSAFYRACIEQMHEDYRSALEDEHLELTDHDRLLTNFYNQLDQMSQQLLAFYRPYKPYLPTNLHDMMDLVYCRHDTLCVDIFGDAPCQTFHYPSLSLRKSV